MSKPATLTTRSKPVNAVAHVRQLCHLGLSPELALPAILTALHDLVDSDSNGFFWVDENYDITNICAEKLLPPEVMRRYFDEFYDAPETNFRRRLRELAGQKDVVQIMTFTEQFYRSEYYNKIWKHFGAHHVMYAVVRRGGTCYGQLSLYRSHGERPFSARDQRELARVVGYITDLFASPRKAADSDIPLDRYYDSGYSGMMTLDENGEIAFASPQAQRLYFLATHPQISRRSLVAAFSEDRTRVLGRLAEQLRATPLGYMVPPARIDLRNCWGEFVLSGYRLQPHESQASGGIEKAAAQAGKVPAAASNPPSALGIVIEYREPMPIRLLNNMKRSSLSVRQTEVALRLAFGHSQPDIAEQLSIKLGSVEYYKKEAYRKLDVHDRQGLRERLLN
jgi:DNA-binding CsgD family transcriptional regulator